MCTCILSGDCVYDTRCVFKRRLARAKSSVCERESWILGMPQKQLARKGCWAVDCVVECMKHKHGRIDVNEHGSSTARQQPMDN